MIRRIMSRAEIARIMIADFEETTLEQERPSYEKREQAQKSFMFYILADNDTVKIYNSVEHGGTVVEIKE